MLQYSLHRIGFGLCALGLLLSFFIFIPSIRGLGIGIWPQSETSIFTLNFFAFVNTVGLLLLSLSKPKLLIRLFSNPLVLLPFCIGFLSLCLLPFHDLPVRSILGSVRTGEGIVWWLSLSTLSASAFLLWRFPFWRKAIITAALISFAICFVLSVSHKLFEHYWAPFFFPDYLALIILVFLPLAYSFWSKKHKGLLFYIPFYIALNVLLISTVNMALIGFGLVVPLFFWWFWSSIKNHRTYSYVLILLIPFFWILLFIGISQVNIQDGFYTFKNTGAFRTIASRAYLVDSTIQSPINEPSHFITGHGWGSAVEHFTNNLPTDWLDFNYLEWDQWDGLVDDHFHSHNMYLDTMIGSGLVGMLLLYLYFFLFCANSKKIHRKSSIIQSAGFLAWGSLWFLLPIHLPFLAFAAASTCKHSRFSVLTRLSYRHVLLRFVLVSAALLQIFSAYVVFSTAYAIHKYQPKSLSVDEAKNNCPIEYQDFNAGGLHLSRVLLDRLRHTVGLVVSEDDDVKKEDLEKIPDHIKNINHLFCESSYYIENKPSSARLQIAHLMARAEILLALGDYLDSDTKNFYYGGWKQELKKWILERPKRSDLATSFFLYNVMHGMERESVEIIDLIYNQNPKDPIGLWFKGLLLLNSDTNKGIQMMKSALDLGIERFVLVEDDVKIMLKE